MGKVAIAIAKIAYAWFRDLCTGERWRALAARGAGPQRLLWASTGTKNPRYSKTLYVDELIGPDMERAWIELDSVLPARVKCCRTGEGERETIIRKAIHESTK